MTRLTGRVIKGYQLEQRVGAGAFGVVYRAKHIITGDSVAIKVILPAFANRPDFIRSFESEARLAARLEHWSIVPLYDYWRDPDGAFMVMRYFPANLSHRLAQVDGGLDLKEVLAIFERVAAALALAHRQAIIHCDIKPANILLDQDGNAYLSDFGIARVLNEAEPPDDSTAAEAFKGTLAYSSPEQFTGQPLTTRTDIYGLGILLFEMLCGQRPFTGSISRLIHSHVKEDLPSIRSLRPDLPVGIELILKRATAKDPQSRYSHVNLMIAQLQALVSGESSNETQEVARVMILDSDNPYKALRPFEETDAVYFFGRHALVRQILTQLQADHPHQRFLSIAGPSGIGKTSLVQAGLIPAIRRGQVRGSESWFIARMHPDKHPMRLLESLLLGLAGEHPVEEIGAMLASGPSGLVNCAAHILPDGAEFLLIIDSFERFYSLPVDETERAHFIQLITRAAYIPDSRVRVICVMRVDSMDQAMHMPGFGELLQERSILVGPLRPDELRDAIVGPVRRLGLEVDRDLLAALVADAADMRFALPMLELVMSEVFYKRREGHLTLSAYVEAGGIKGALNQKAERVYQSLDRAEQETAHNLFMHLITSDPNRRDVLQWVNWPEIQDLAENLPSVRDAFVNNRLLLSAYHPFTHVQRLSLPHDVMLHKWDRLRGWLDARHTVRPSVVRTERRSLPLQATAQIAAVFALMVLGAAILLGASIITYQALDTGPQDGISIAGLASSQSPDAAAGTDSQQVPAIVTRQIRSLEESSESNRLAELAARAHDEDDITLAVALAIKAIQMDTPSDYAMSLMAEWLNIDLMEAFELGPQVLVEQAEARFDLSQLSCEQREEYELEPLCTPDKR